MEKEELIKNGYDMLYLSVCAVNGIVPDSERLKKMDMEKVAALCMKHSIGGLCSFALESAGIKNEMLVKEKNQTIRKVMMFDSERANICKFFEEKGIWYMPLKGVYMKEYYPKLGMRSMSDNDILVDSSKIDEIRTFMTGCGYENYGKGKSDEAFTKAPYNYEMHKLLFAPYSGEVFYEYYKDIKSKLIKTENSNYGYCFSKEDFYIYMITHEYKHFSNVGTGLRSLVDVYVYNRKFGNELDREYIEGECNKLGIAEFEKSNRELADKVLSSAELPCLSKQEKEMLIFFFSSGTFGNIINRTELMMKKIEKSEKGNYKLHFLLRRLFPPIEIYVCSYPFFYKHKILLPIAWFHRLVRGIFCKNKMIRTEMNMVMKHKK